MGGFSGCVKGGNLQPSEFRHLRGSTGTEARIPFPSMPVFLQSFCPWMNSKKEEEGSVFKSGKQSRYKLKFLIVRD